MAGLNLPWIYGSCMDGSALISSRLLKYRSVPKDNASLVPPTSTSLNSYRAAYFSGVSQIKSGARINAGRLPLPLTA